ncbi:MAG: phosphoglycerate kinase [Bacilli bacterium]|nr:phosphoglycerate kinase [Bacilli bacterium]
MLMKKDITDFKLKNQRVIVRCDLNVPIKDGVILDDTRIKACLETIEHLVSAKAKVIILSHLGRVKEEKDKETNSLRPVADKLSELIGRPVKFVPYTRGMEVENAINSMEPRDIVMLENTRFEDLNGNKESGNDSELAHYWASLGDIFINDAFGTIHRAHASNVGIAKLLPSGIGFLVKNEIEKISSALNNPERPLVIMLGGAKVSDKIGVINNAVKIADYVLIGGGMPYTFFKALGYNVGLSIVDDSSLEFCRNIYSQYKNKILLPEDIVVASSISEGASTRITTYADIGSNEVGIDIGMATISRYKSILMNANTIIWNGPIGMFEIAKFSQGTRKVVEILSSSKAKIVVGGGDTISALNKFGFNNKRAHISTGGGATLEMLEGKELPGLSAISDK